jgi:hypothetical protein
MPINYRRVNPSAHAADVMKQRAMEFEERAFHCEMDERRLRVLLDIEPNSALLAEALIKAPGEAQSMRAKARRAAGAAPLTPEEVLEVREGYLNTWLEKIEEQHATQTAFSTEAQRLLKLKGKDALSSKERKEIEDEVPEGEKTLAELEAVHNLITETLDAIRDHPDHPGDPSTNGNGTDVDPKSADQALGKGVI